MTDAIPEMQVEETIALLQEEIARLEAELAVRDERPMASIPDHAERIQQPGYEAEILELRTLLDERDRTIELLWEELSQLEASLVRGREEWQQLQEWVEALEQRVDRGNDQTAAARGGDQPGEELGAIERDLGYDPKHRSSEPPELANENGQPGAQPETLTHCADSSLGQSGSEDLALAAERLAEMEGTRERLRAALAELESVRSERDRLVLEADQRLRDHERELAGLRAQSVCPRSSESPESLNVDLRLRAFREHLNEIQIRDDAERRSRSLSNRIAALWRRSGRP